MPLAGGVAVSSAAEAMTRARPLLRGRLLLACDFDGTISRLGLDPWRAAVIPSAQRALRQLAGSPRTHVALISGRSVPDLAGRVRVGGASYHGDHGAERARTVRGFRPAHIRVEREPADPAVTAMAERLKTGVPPMVAEPWLVLEDKGPALTFHFRGAPDTDAARRRVRAAVDAIDTDGLLDQPGGRRAWELRPPGATTKGMTLERLMGEYRPDTVLMLGDDRNDALAFDALRAARDDGRVQGLAIAVVSPAADATEIAPRADLVFPGSSVAARFLGLLARARADA